MYQQANVLAKLGYLGKVLKLLNENTVHFLIAAEDSAVKGRRYKKNMVSRTVLPDTPNVFTAVDSILPYMSHLYSHYDGKYKHSNLYSGLFTFKPMFYERRHMASNNKVPD